MAPDRIPAHGERTRPTKTSKSACGAVRTARGPQEEDQTKCARGEQGSAGTEASGRGKVCGHGREPLKHELMQSLDISGLSP